MHILQGRQWITKATKLAGDKIVSMTIKKINNTAEAPHDNDSSITSQWYFYAITALYAQTKKLEAPGTNALDGCWSGKNRKQAMLLVPGNKVIEADMQ